MQPPFDLTALDVKPNAKCVGAERWEIVTPPGRWHYALEAPCTFARSTGRLIASLTVHVTQGEVGVGLLSKDRQRFQHEAVVPASDRETMIELVAPADDLCALVVRNASASGASAACVEVKDWRWLEPSESVAAPSLFPPRIPVSAILSAGDLARRRYPDRAVIILADTPATQHADPRFQVIDCTATNAADLTPETVAASVFVYACDYDDLGLPFIAAITRAGGVYFPATSGRPPSTLYHRNAIARRAMDEQKALQDAEGFAKWDAADFLNILQMIDLTAALPGAYVEIGCYRGSSAAVALHYMAALKLRRECWFFDIFDGFTYAAAAASADQAWLGTHETEGEDVIAARLKRWNRPDGPQVHVKRANIIEDDALAAVGDIAIANIDVDLYEAVAAALAKVAPRMVRGGVIIVEDPGHTPWLVGARLALDEFLKSPDGKRFSPFAMESGQTFLLRAY